MKLLLAWCKRYCSSLQASREGRSIVGVAAALPCPSLPDAHAAAAAADVRAGTQSGAAADRCPNGLMANGGPPVRAPRALPFTTLTAGWSPGISSGALTP